MTGRKMPQTAGLAICAEVFIRTGLLIPICAEHDAKMFWAEWGASVAQEIMFETSLER
jgi:hypothetical protein